MAEQVKKKKKYHSINGKMYQVIVLLVFAAAIIGIFQSSGYYVFQVLGSFSEKTTEISASYADFFNDSDLIELSKVVASDAFQEVQKKAKAENNPELLNQFLADADLLSYAETCERRLARIQRTTGSAGLYIASCGSTGCYYILDSEETFVNSGKPLPFTPEAEYIEQRQEFFAGYSHQATETTPRIVRYVSGAPIGTADDSAQGIWLVGEMDFLPLLKSLRSFLFRMVVFLLILSTICAIVGVLILRRLLTTPILKLKRSVNNFETHNSVEKSALPIDPGIQSSDELGDLSSSLYSLEQNVYETQQELAKMGEERGRMNAELSIAASIQQGVLPSKFPSHTCFDLYGLMQPAREVGGDFFDFFMVDNDHLALVIADVSDKGIPASLFMMTSKTLIKAQTLSGKDPAEVLHTVNNLLSENNPANFFVTVWIGILDLHTGRMTAANGGHEYPIISLNGKPFEVFKDPHGLALGMMENAKYRNYELQFRPNDRLVVYSDGATDAIDTSEKDFGLDRVLKTVQEQSAGHHAKELVHGILDTLMDYSKDTYQFDDITLLSITYLSQKQQKDTEESAS